MILQGIIWHIFEIKNHKCSFNENLTLRDIFDSYLSNLNINIKMEIKMKVLFLTAIVLVSITASANVCSDYCNQNYSDGLKACSLSFEYCAKNSTSIEFCSSMYDSCLKAITSDLGTCLNTCQNATKTKADGIEPNFSEPSCYSDSDCGSGEFCSSGSCVMAN